MGGQCAQELLVVAASGHFTGCRTLADKDPVWIAQAISGTSLPFPALHLLGYNSFVEKLHLISYNVTPIMGYVRVKRTLGILSLLPLNVHKLPLKTEIRSVVIKVGMVGDSQIGKTSLLVNYVEGSFDEDYIQTLGVNFMEKTISVRRTTITFSIWDLGGQREFVNMLPLVCNDAVAILFMFDLSAQDPESSSCLVVPEKPLWELQQPVRSRNLA
ncbi:P-loop containing nucleoside triphosphate hydrolase protein [Marasmius fiardii PR-910]|nr:P-loop containing nucleoside triphosphate hydrolase protein [Marasmius fiardii PR-910]